MRLVQEHVKKVVVAGELTKLYEEIQRGTATDLLAHYRAHKPRGEFTLVIAAPSLPAGEAGAAKEGETR